MKKLLFFIVVCGLVAGGYFGYQKWFKDYDLSIWSLVPADAFLVLEIDDALTTWQQQDTVKTWKALKTLPALQRADADLAFLDSIGGDQQSLQRLFENNPLLVSMSLIAKDEFDFLFLLEVQNIQQHSIITELTNKLRGQFKHSTRKYLGKTISELAGPDLIFTYIFYKNYFIGSFTPFLVEDAIRTIDQADYQAFQETNTELFQLAKLAQDQGNLYVNSTKLDLFAEIFASEVQVDLKNLSRLTDKTFLDLRISENSILLNGFSINTDPEPNYLSTFDNNAGVPISILNYIPDRTAWTYHFSFTNPQQWFDRWQRMWLNENPSILTSRRDVLSKYDFNVEEVKSLLGTELALVAGESNSLDNQNYLLIFQSNDIGEAYNQFNRFSERIARIEGDSVFREPYREYEIRQLNVVDFPAMLLGPQFVGFPSTFYLPIEGNIIMANNLQSMKQLLDAISNENTWGKSIRMTQFFELMNKEANINLIVDTNRALSSLLSYCRPKWAELFEENALMIRSFENVAVQFSNIENKYYTNIVLSQPGSFEAQKTNENVQLRKSISFASPIATAPQFSRSHVDRSLELTLQDATGNFYHLSSQLEVIWSDSLPYQMNSDLYQLDYYKNNKLQFIFSTEDKLYAFDREGNSIPGYPVDMRARGGVDHFNVIDYNKTKDYRLVTATDKGAIYLMDKSGTPLGSWDPLRLGSQLVHKPFHLRIASRDLIVAMLKNGVVHARNRRGESYPGFPLDLKESLTNELYISEGATLATTKLTSITAQGSIIEFNLEGAILKREQLYKPLASSSFRLVQDALNTGYLIGRKDDTRIAILDQNGNVLFEKDYLSAGEVKFQYYNFGAGNEVLVVIDTEQSFGYLYDRKGNLLNFRPLETSNTIGLIYSENRNEFRIYKVYENELTEVSLKR